MEGELSQAIGGLALFVGLWCGICLGLAYAGGWQALARVYPDSPRSEGRRFHFCSARVGAWVSYNSSLSVGANAWGVRLAVWPIFRPGHPPLFIPWNEISSGLERLLGMRLVVLSFAQTPTTRVRISYGLAKKLARESGGSFQLPLPGHDQDRQPIR